MKMTMCSPKYCIMMWILKQQFADKDPQAHSRRTEPRTVHSQHHSRHWQGNYGSDRVMSTTGIDPFELRQRELDTEIEIHQSRNGHPRPRLALRELLGYNRHRCATRSMGFGQVESHEGGSPPRLEFAELLRWQRDHGNVSYDDCDRLRHRCATRVTGFDTEDSYNPHWHRRQEQELKHRSRR